MTGLRSTSTLARVAAWLLGGVVSVAALGLLAVYTSPVRDAILARASVWIKENAGLALVADDLSYSLLDLRVQLTGLSLASADASSEPFLVANRVTADLDWSPFGDGVQVASIDVEGARAFLHRRPDGSTNLPEGGDPQPGEPSALPIGRLRVMPLRVEVRDDPSDVTVTFPRLEIDVGDAQGQLRALDPGSLSRGDRGTTISVLDGDLRFDGRRVHLDRLRLEADEVQLSVTGTVAVLVERPAAELAFDATVDLGAATAWAEIEAAVRGLVSASGQVSGPFSAPIVDARLSSDEIGVNEWRLSAIDAAVQADLDAVRLDRLEASIGGGVVTADGRWEMAASRAVASVGWTGVSHALLDTLLSRQPFRVPGVSSGSAALELDTADLSTLTLQATNRATAPEPRAGQIAVSGETRLDVAQGVWRLEGEHRVLGASLALDVGGELDVEEMTASTLGGIARVGPVMLGPLVDALVRSRLVEAGALDLRGGSGDAEIRLAGTLGAPSLDADLNVVDVLVADLPAWSAEIGVRGSAAAADVAAAVVQGENEIDVQGRVLLNRERLDAMQLSALVPHLGRMVPGGQVEGAAELVFELSGPFTALEGTGRVQVTGARYGDAMLGPATATVTLADGAALVAAALPDLGAEVDATIGLAAPYEAAGDLRVAALPIERLIDRASLPSPLSGTLSLNARVTGPLEDWRGIDGDIEVYEGRVRFGDLPASVEVPLRAAVSSGRLRVDAFRARVGGAAVDVAGALPIDPQPGDAVAEGMTATLSGQVSALLEAIGATGLVEVPRISGTSEVALLARAEGSLREPRLSADLDVQPGTLQWGDLPPVEHLRAAARVADGLIELSAVSASWQDAGLDISGRAPLRLFEPYLPAFLLQGLPEVSSPAELSGRIRGITPAVLEPFLDSDTRGEIDGRLDASLSLTATSLAPADIRGDVRLDALEVSASGLSLRQQQPTQVSIADGFARVTSWDWAGQGASLAVRGQVGLQTRQSALIANGRLDLRMLAPFVRPFGLAVSGDLLPRVVVTGDIGAPRIDGDLALARGEMRMSDPRVSVTNLSARAVLSRSTLHLTGLDGLLNGGTLSGSGTVGLSPDAAAAELALSVNGAALEIPEGLRSEVDADLTLTASDPAGEEPAGGRISGVVTIVQSAYREPLALSTGLLAALRDRTVVTSVRDGESFADRLVLDIRVLTGDDLVVDNNYARLTAGADLRVIGTAAQPGLSGRAELRPGGQLFIGRNMFNIERGVVDFANPTLIEPDLDVLATTSVAGEDIELPITGTPDQLDATPISVTTPALGPAEVWSILLTGRTLEQIGGDEAQVVGEQVLGYLSGDALGVASRAVGLDSIRLGGVSDTTLRQDPGAVATETDPTSRLTFAKSIGPQVELTYSQSFRDSAAQTWIVEYLPLRQVALRLISNDENLRAYEFRHEIALGAPASPAPRRPRVREPNVGEVRFTGDLVFPEARLRSAIDLDHGDRFDHVEWQEDRDRLESLYRDNGYFEV
ncbi:MAG: hypothetical protein FJW23_14520, partial [Acidimicrobiia bacterium]|nr:hypothetical protein [Acidimicrobiia bacterium]